MNRAQKATIAGIVIGAAVLVFVPKVYVKIAGMVGKYAEIQTVTTGTDGG